MKKIKITIKSILGKIIFEHAKEDNTIKQTVEEATLRGVDLRGANLRGANLCGADLYEANLRGTILRGATLRGATLRGATLRGAVKIKKAIFLINIYEYDCAAIITENNQFLIKLGCYTRTLEDWENNFWNNDSEFPNDGSIHSELRKLAFETCKRWIEINK